MVAIGLVADLTSKAAKQAALGAGARVLKTYSFQLTEADRAEIMELDPDICLLAGGTDGGNSENILHNAKVLASLPHRFLWLLPVIDPWLPRSPLVSRDLQYLCGTECDAADWQAAG